MSVNLKWAMAAAALLMILSGCGSNNYLVPPGAHANNGQIAADQQAVEERYQALQFNLQRAVATEESALVKDPTWAAGYSRLGQLFWDADQPHAALKEAQRACALAPKSQTFWNNLGEMAVSMQQWSLARHAYHHTLHLDPANWQAMVGLGQIAVALHQWNNARVLADKALAVAGPQGPIYVLFGEVAQNANDWTTAATYYRNAIAANPAWWEGYYDMAIVDVHWGEIAQAESNIRQALHDNPDSAAPWILLQSLPQTSSTRP
ncbi:MAG: hypothetical protein C7B44_03600 [Sulfobacillus thermosulfidooxidans]|nr:MAG: hypothetical protein C7B44_03600 [Sulfobacillus thermosulfidooxidans]